MREQLEPAASVGYRAPPCGGEASGPAFGLRVTTTKAALERDARAAQTSCERRVSRAAVRRRSERTRFWSASDDDEGGLGARCASSSNQLRASGIARRRAEKERADPLLVCE